MEQYLMTVATAAAAGIVADILNDAFCSRWQGIGKYIRFGITVCIACVIVVPLIGYVKNIRDVIIPVTADYKYDTVDSAADSLYILEKECSEKLAERMTEVTGIVPCEVRVEMALEGDAPHITDAVAVLEASDAEAVREIERISLEVLGTNVRILIKENNDKADG